MIAIEESLPLYHQEIHVEQDQQGKIKVTSVFCFPESFSAFQGHFPDIPILPGIIQLYAVRYLAEQALQKRLVPTHFSKTKFRSMVSPEQEVYISLDLNKQSDNYTGKFKISKTDNSVIATGNYTFSERSE